MPEKGHKMIEIKSMYYPSEAMISRVNDAVDTLMDYCERMKHACYRCCLYGLCHGCLRIQDMQEEIMRRKNNVDAV